LTELGAVPRLHFVEISAHVDSSFGDFGAVVKVRGARGGSAPCSHLSPPAIV